MASNVTEGEMTLQSKMVAQKKKLEEIIESDFELLPKLVSSGALTLSEYDDIGAEKTASRKSKALLDIIIENGKQQELITALRDSGQSHVVNWIEANGVYRDEFGLDWPLTEREAEILQCNFAPLTTLIDTVHGFLGRLFSDSVISQLQLDFIESKTTSFDRAKAFLGILRRFSLDKYSLTVKCLRQSNQDHIAEVLVVGGVLVAVHSTQQAQNTEAAEVEIVQEMTRLLSERNASLEPTHLHRLFARLLLKVAAFRKGDSIVLYVCCYKRKEFDRLCTIVDNDEMKEILDWLFSVLLQNNQAKVLLVNIAGDDAENARRWFQCEELRDKKLDEHFRKLSSQLRYELEPMELTVTKEKDEIHPDKSQTMEVCSETELSQSSGSKMKTGSLGKSTVQQLKTYSRDWSEYNQRISMGDEIVRVEPYWHSERNCLGTGSFREVYKGHCDQDSTAFSHFVQRLLFKPQTKHHLYCGSFFELPVYYIFTNITDVDRMRIYPHILTIPWEPEEPKNVPLLMLQIDTRHTPPGFAKLLSSKNQPQGTYYTKYMIDEDLHRGPAHTVSFSEWSGLGNNMIEYIFRHRKVFLEFLVMTLDEVDAIICPHWPTHADEWRKRQTLSGWPDENLKEKVIRGGCHLVFKPHFSNPQDETVWRFSFSQAELILIHSWNDVQKYIYHLLRIIKRQVSKNCTDVELGAFGNYLFKTLMFWACEEKPAEFWKEDEIESSVGELLCSAVECLIERKCPQYFIPDNNILGCSDDVHYANAIEMLINFDNAKIKQLMIEFPRCDDSVIFTLNQKFLLHLKLITRKYYIFNTLEEPIQTYKANEFSEDTQLLLEFQDLFKAVDKHLASLSSTDTKQKNRLTEEAKKFYTDCVNDRFESEESYETIPLNESVHQIIQRCIRIKPMLFSGSPDEHQLNRMTTDALSSGLESCQISCRSEINFLQTLLHDSKDTDKILDTLRSFSGQHWISKESQSARSDSHGNEKANEIGKMIEIFFSFAFGDILKNPTYIIRSAFAANFYYGRLQEYSKSLDICKSVLENEISSFKLSFKWYIESLFAVFFDVNNMPLYDKNIQTVFGFINLFLKTSWKAKDNLYNIIPFPDFLESEFPVTNFGNRSSLSNRSSPMMKSMPNYSTVTPYIVIQVSPIEFLKYIGTQCRKRLNLEPDPKFDVISHEQSGDNRLLLNCSLLKAADSIGNP